MIFRITVARFIADTILQRMQVYRPTFCALPPRSRFRRCDAAAMIARQIDTRYCRHVMVASARAESRLLKRNLSTSTTYEMLMRDAYVYVVCVRIYKFL